ncbi:MAG: hypothetical protein V4555_00090, partial [Acidobacteriota bacterium]
MLLTRRYFLNGLAAGALGLACVSGVAQGAVVRSCNLDARNRYNMPLPVLAPGTMDAALAAKLRRGFDLIYVAYEPAQAEVILRPALARAEGLHDLCGEALADFGLGQIARSLHLDQALPHFRRAEELLRQVGTPMALAHVHNRLALTESLLGDRQGFARDEPPVAQEYAAAGDAASAVMERSNFEAPAAGESTAEHQARVYKELDAIHTPNVTMVRGMVSQRWAAMLGDAGRTREALEKAHDAVGFFKQCDCGPVTLAATYVQMGLLGSQNEDPSTILLYGLEADRIYRRLHLDVQRASSLRIIGLAYDSQFAYPQAREAYQQALDIAVAQKSVPQIVNAVVSLAQAWDRSGEAAKGVALIERMRTKDLGPLQECQYESELGFLAPDAGLYARGEETSKRWFKNCVGMFSGMDESRQAASLAMDLLGEGKGEEALTYARMGIEKLEEQRKLIPMTDRSQVAFEIAN